MRLRAAASAAHPNTNANTSARNVKLLAWCSRVPATLFFFPSPAERGGIGDVRKRVREEAVRRRAPEEEVCEEVSIRARAPTRVGCLWFYLGARLMGCVCVCVGVQTIAFLDSTLIRVPGYEPIYNHEIQPQEVSGPEMPLSGYF